MDLQSAYATIEARLKELVNLKPTKGGAEEKEWLELRMIDPEKQAKGVNKRRHSRTRASNLRLRKAQSWLREAFERCVLEFFHEKPREQDGVIKMPAGLNLYLHRSRKPYYVLDEDGSAPLLFSEVHGGMRMILHKLHLGARQYKMRLTDERPPFQPSGVACGKWKKGPSRGRSQIRIRLWCGQPKDTEENTLQEPFSFKSTFRSSQVRLGFKFKKIFMDQALKGFITKNTADMFPVYQGCLLEEECGNGKFSWVEREKQLIEFVGKNMKNAAGEDSGVGMECEEDDGKEPAKEEPVDFLDAKSMLGSCSPLFAAWFGMSDSELASDDSYTSTQASPKLLEHFLVYCESYLVPAGQYRNAGNGHFHLEMAKFAHAHQLTDLLKLCELVMMRKLVSVQRLCTVKSRTVENDWKIFMEICETAGALELPLLLGQLHFSLIELDRRLPAGSEQAVAWERFLDGHPEFVAAGSKAVEDLMKN